MYFIVFDKSLLYCHLMSISLSIYLSLLPSLPPPFFCTQAR